MTTKENTSKGHKKWTVSETLTAITMFVKGSSEKQIASTLGRTQASVGNQIWKVCRDEKSAGVKVVKAADPELLAKAVELYESSRKKMRAEVKAESPQLPLDLRVRAGDEAVVGQVFISTWADVLCQMYRQLHEIRQSLKRLESKP